LVLVSVWVRGRVVLAALPHGLQGGSHEVGPGAAHEVGEERPGDRRPWLEGVAPGQAGGGPFVLEAELPDRVLDHQAGVVGVAVDRGRTGSKHHLITDGTGIPLAFTLTGGNRNEVTQLVLLLEAVPPVRGKCGRPRRRPTWSSRTADTTTTSTGGWCANSASGH